MVSQGRRNKDVPWPPYASRSKMSICVAVLGVPEFMWVVKDTPRRMVVGAGLCDWGQCCRPPPARALLVEPGELKVNSSLVPRDWLNARPRTN